MLKHIFRKVVGVRLLLVIFSAALLIPLSILVPAQAATDTFTWTDKNDMLQVNHNPQTPFTAVYTNLNGGKVDICSANKPASITSGGSPDGSCSTDDIRASFSTTGPMMILESTESGCLTNPQSSGATSGAAIRVNGVDISGYNRYGDILVLDNYPLASHGKFQALDFGDSCRPYKNALGDAQITNGWPGGHLGIWTNSAAITDLTANSRAYSEKSISNGTMTLASSDGCQLVVPNPDDSSSGTDFTTATSGKATCSGSSTVLTLTNQYVDVAVVAVWSDLEGVDTGSGVPGPAKITITNVPPAYQGDPGLQDSGIAAGDVYQRDTITGGDMLLDSFDHKEGCDGKLYTMQVNNYTTALMATITYRVRVGKNLTCSAVKTIPVALGQTYSDFKDCTNNNNCIPPPGSNPTNGGTTCQNANGPDNSLSWAVCPIADGLANTLNSINGIIASFLIIPVDKVFNTGFQTVFGVFRDIGEALLVIAGLIMVVSQAADLEIFSAHTVRKVLPRLIIAAIGMSLAWPLLKYGIQFFNDVGSTIGDVIIHAAQAGGACVSSDSTSAIFGAIFTLIFGFLYELLRYGRLGFLFIILSIVIFVLIALAVLALRLLVILLCVITSPLAIAAWVLPSTEKMWRFWKDSLLTMLIMFPIIMALLASGAALAQIIGCIQ